MGNPVDSYFSEYSGRTKTASIGKTLSGAGQAAFSSKGLMTLGMHTSAVIGAEMLISAARKAYGAATKNMDQKQMIEVNPDLVEYQQRDPRKFNQHYSSLRHLNPVFASDPVVAGSYMRRMSEFPENAGNILVESIGNAPRIAPTGVKDYAAGLNVMQSAAPPSEMDQLRLEQMRNSMSGTPE